AYALEPSDYAAITSSAMGIDVGEEEIMMMGKRLYNIEKAFNTIHAGFGREDDLPPKRYMDEPVKSGPHKGAKCDREKFKIMLDEFYELNGWDGETGLQTRSGLMDLGLDDVAKKLEKAGKLIEK
ncbi:MAG: aldehyde ferredoxin oxidoreductase C-terminal domain-containing protein, partial [Methanobacteriota archaeon]